MRTKPQDTFVRHWSATCISVSSSTVISRDRTCPSHGPLPVVPHGAKNYNDIVRKYGLAATRDFLKEADPFHDAESDNEYWHRVEDGFALIADNPRLKDGDHVLQISHGNTLLSLMHRFAPEGYDLSERPANGSVTCLDFDTNEPMDRAVSVVSYNQ